MPWLYIGSTGSAFGLHLEDCVFTGANVMVPLSERGAGEDDARLIRLYNRLSFKRW